MDKKQIKVQSQLGDPWNNTSEVTGILPGTNITITPSDTGIPIISRIAGSNNSFQFFDQTTYLKEITPPTNASFAKITMVGGGGAGGDSPTNTTAVSGAGGGGGSTIIIYLHNVQNYTFEISVGDPNSTNVLQTGDTIFTMLKLGVPINKFIAGGGQKGNGSDRGGIIGGSGGIVDNSGITDSTDIVVLTYNGSAGNSSFGSYGGDGGNSSICGGAGGTQGSAGISAAGPTTGCGGSGCSGSVVGDGGKGSAGYVSVEYT